MGKESGYRVSKIEHKFEECNNREYCRRSLNRDKSIIVNSQ